ncbi:MAG: hypothetical protein US62_C0019G0001 [Candidatus Woesebacteria bacterium GW2011_GWA1_37_8]|uniref:Uncharacterized protein n=1 Tax=Candidatus Woesebacteria bacterium GW2011_GWA1_37_8 TaxID=1618546 RepID=A0A0G0K7A6_9BACT|nr:MAG: hypothetical protein US39_C0002G0001 [Microgenomates group bacterium GW2011_GWC1_37_12b]KKQ44969.1 MAG: hypothetical protein US62_C0019G0001 [Candidatus Woesebacteria bacterium GW2011_GWA1_37_8]
MKNKKLLIVIGVGAFFFLICFYWFQIRPVQVKASCDKRIRSESGGKITIGYETKYNTCLHEKGIK